MIYPKEQLDGILSAAPTKVTCKSKRQAKLLRFALYRRANLRGESISIELEGTSLEVKATKKLSIRMEPLDVNGRP